MKDNDKIKELLTDELLEMIKQLEQEYDGIVIIQDRIIKYANRRLAKLLGYTLEENIGTPFARYVHPDELPKVVNHYVRRMAGEEVTPIYETVLMHKDGSKVYTEFRPKIITYQGKPADLVLIQDITKQKRA